MCQFSYVPTLKLTVTVRGMSATLNKLRKMNVSVSTNIPPYSDDTIHVCGILGNGVLQHLSVFDMQNIFDRKMLCVANGFVPNGSIKFLITEIATHSKSVKNTMICQQLLSI